MHQLTQLTSNSIDFLEGSKPHRGGGSRPWGHRGLSWPGGAGLHPPLCSTSRDLCLAHSCHTPGGAGRAVWHVVHGVVAGCWLRTGEHHEATWENYFTSSEPIAWADFEPMFSFLLFLCFLQNDERVDKKTYHHHHHIPIFGSTWSVLSQLAAWMRQG